MAPATRKPGPPSWVFWAIGVVVALLVGGVIGFAIGRADAGAPPTADPSVSLSPSAPVPSAAPSSASTLGPVPSATPVPPPPADSADIALQKLNELPLEDGYSDARYDRTLFGDPWTDVDRNGCDTRNDILGRDLLSPVFKAGTNDCKVLSGALIDPYDGQAVDFVSGRNTSVLVQIDHVVALAWAWRHGAEFWTDERRLQFANDPINLAAASEDMNQEKSDSAPGEWLPPVPELQCVYVENWVGVLSVYGLGINAEDKAAASAVLAGC